MRQRKIQTYVFSLYDNCGKGVEGFDKVAHVITDYYQGLLGKQRTQRERIDTEIMQNGGKLNVE